MKKGKRKNKTKAIKNCKDIIAIRKKAWESHHSKNKDLEFIDVVANMLTKDDAQGRLLREEIMLYPEYLIEMVFTIIDKNKSIVPFFLNEAQHQLVNKINERKKAFREGKANWRRFVILKSRQMGCTSFISAYQLVVAITQPNFEGMTIAHTSPDTTKIFEKKAKQPFRLLPAKLKPEEKTNNRRELNFGKLNSVWSIMTAGSSETGRGGTGNFAHLSEVAFFPHMDKILSGMAQALTKDAIMLLESTANGYNDFKTLWDDAEAGRNNYVPIFLYWWDDPGYVLDFENKEVGKTFRDNVRNSKDSFFIRLNKLRLMEKLTYKQLYWYYSKFKELKDNLLQEYPCYPSDAFLATGRPYFDTKIIDSLIIGTRDVRIRKKEHGGLVVTYELPKQGHTYVLGADVAEGLADGDYSSAAMYDLADMRQVLKIHGHIDPPTYGKLLVKYGMLYNEAYLGIESNNHGHSVLNTVYNVLAYTNIHFTVNQDLKRAKATKRKGWLTNESSKYLMLDELEQALSENLIHISDVKALEQLREVTVDSKGKASINGRDMVVAHAIAYQMRKFVKRTIFLW